MMPEIKLQHVVSFSSEDKNNPADNLLKPEGTHKWKCATPGEKSISVVLQFEKASQIQSLDIGNEGSAFVEVLVGRSSATSDHDYQVLLVASAFMTPLEARNGTNRTSVRMFDVSKLSAPVASQKWDRVKIVCTQPFNKTSTFGLSFIKFHSPSPPGERGDGEGEKKMGFFKLKTDDKDDVKTGNLFSHRGKQESVSPSAPLSGAAAVRAASRLADQSKPSVSTPAKSVEHSKPSSSSTTSSTPAKQSDSGKREDKKSSEKKTPTPSQNREKRKHKVSDEEDSDDGTDDVPPLRKQSTSLSSVASKDSGKGAKPPPLKKTKSEPPKESPVKEFSKIMENVVFVISGFQNPYRGELRDRALAMGATYKPDWGKGCTHLICAFPNTPKYNQVKGKGRIVDKKWIADCYKQKKLLPWRNYRLGDADSPDEDSDEELTKTKTPSKPQKDTKEKKETPKPAPVVDVGDDEEEMYGGDTDSGEDTEDEVRRIKEQQQKKKSPAKSPEKPKSVIKSPPESTKNIPSGDDADPYDVDTDEDEKPGTSAGAAGDDSDADSGLPELPDFFAGKHFFIYGEMEAAKRRLLTRYITAYAGELEDYMNERVKYVVTSSKWDSNFDDALSDNPNLVFVKPSWVEKCHEKVKMIPHQPYVVIPDD